MSHAATINYEAISIAARATCEQALKQLCKIDELLAKIKETASMIITDRVRSYEKALKKEQSKITDALNEIISKANSNNRDATIADNANNLSKIVDNLTSYRLNALEDLIDDELINATNRHQQNLNDQGLGVVNIEQDILKKLEAVDDFMLRESIYQVAIQKENLNKLWSDLQALGKERLTKQLEYSLEKHKEKIILDIKKELKEAKVDQQIIENISSSEIKNVSDIEMVRNKATSEIIGETVRKETLKVIMKTVETRGFIVDKKNIKIDRENNEVRFVAQKISGQRAEFRIYLDGKFIYKFDGYEGQACQEDIEPFMKDLADIYDIKVVKQVDNWSNPDKNQSMKYQTVNKNKGTN
ncbi:MAG: hypothetical protein RBS24_04795 [Bacilli bacterium]|nr:hypothetical protein [Bacilli bacterium]